VVKGVDVFSERLRGMLASKDAWKRLKKGGFTVAASEAAAANAQAGRLPKAFAMAHPALIKPFALNAILHRAQAEGRFCGAWRSISRQSALMVWLRIL